MPKLASITGAEPLRDPDWASAYLGVPIVTLYDWRYRRIGPPSYKIGRHIRYRQSEVDRWLEDQRPEAS